MMHGYGIEICLLIPFYHAALSAYAWFVRASILPSASVSFFFYLLADVTDIKILAPPNSGSEKEEYPNRHCTESGDAFFRHTEPEIE